MDEEIRTKNAKRERERRKEEKKGKEDGDGRDHPLPQNTPNGER